MISIYDIKKAMRMLTNPIEYLNCDAVHKQVANSLEVYKGRGEYTGCLKSAVFCLSLANYEIRGDR
jgi:hypothetical protein